MILHLTIRFLDHRYHGRGDGGTSEWPPSPFRVFQALLAGAKSNWTEARSSAFRWLQSIPPPVIHAPSAREPETPLLTYVPNNNARAVRTPKLLRPRILPAGRPVVEYFWDFDRADPDVERHARIIIECARHIRCLGWGIDMAVGLGALDAQLPTPSKDLVSYSPERGSGFGGVPTRVPGPGSLESLERGHENFRSRIRANADTGILEMHDNPGDVHFSICSYAPSPSRPYCAFELCQPDEDDDPISLNPRQIKSLVGMIRGVLGSTRVRNAAGNEIVDSMLLGHPNDKTGPRLSILPLLSIGHQHADARIRRVILAEPFGSDGAICHLLAEILNGQALLPDKPHASPVARLVRLKDSDPYLRRWFGGTARQWATVSPVILPGFDRRIDKRGSRQKALSGVTAMERAEKLVLKSLAHASVSLPCRVEISGVSWWAAVPHARDFIPREKLGPCPRYHVKLTFDQPFTGPLSLGRQRHMGLGVFAAMQQAGE